ncbi:MAG: hypothetical protein WDW38_000142 [Sanguina aurantia]
MSSLWCVAIIVQAPMSSRSSAFIAAPMMPARSMLAPVVSKSTVVMVEAKLKTRKAAAKRYKITGTGLLMGRNAGKQHFNEKKTRCDTLAMSKMFVMHSGDVYNATKCLPNHKIGK